MKLVEAVEEGGRKMNERRGGRKGGRKEVMRDGRRGVLGKMKEEGKREKNEIKNR